jgi:hypothetical protein
MAHTTFDWIRTLKTYPSDTTIRFIGDAMVFDNPDGTPADPLFRWLEPNEEFVVGDGVRKYGYHDKGTVVDLSSRAASILGVKTLAPGYVIVQWDETGQSIEVAVDLGKVD